MKKHNEVILAEDYANQIIEAKGEIAGLIEKAKTEKEADKIFDIVSKMTDDETAKDIWDNWVAWNVVKWKEKAREVL